MCEILFRGKRIDNGEWVEGFYGQFHNRPTINEPNIHQIFVLFAEDEEKENQGHFLSAIGGIWHTIIPETLGQYTGLKDLLDNKIFEGDIVKSIYRLKQVNGVREREIRSSIEYNVGYAYSEVYGVCQRFRDGSGVALLSLIQGTEQADCEVIGNIHDNPELLKGGADNG